MLLELLQHLVLLVAQLDRLVVILTFQVGRQVPELVQVVLIRQNALIRAHVLLVRHAALAVVGRRLVIIVLLV